MTLHPEVVRLIGTLRTAGLRPLHEHTLDELRAARRPSGPVVRGGDLEVRDVEQPTRHGALPVRHYRPSTSSSAGRPLLIWLPGGGWVSGGVESAEPTARRLALAADCAVACLGYPLAPEHPFPIALEACAEVIPRLVEHAAALGADPARVVLGGDSAGANLAAVVAAEGRVSPAGLLLVCPLLDAVGGHPSRREERHGYLVTGETIDWFVRHYLPAGVDPADPRVSPLHAADVAGLPRTHIVTAEHDPLRDEGEAFAGRLRAAGVPVSLTRYDGMIHGFFSRYGVLAASTEALTECASFVAGCVAGGR